MKNTNFKILIFIVIINFLFACSNKKTSEDQERLHERVSLEINAAFHDTEDEIKESVSDFKSVFEKRELSNKAEAPNAYENLSSFYVPSFGSKDALETKKFKLASLPLGQRWGSFIKSHSFVSWMYLFDSANGCLRISPPTPTEMTFGKAMDFTTFEFFKSAVLSYPKVVWQEKAKEDMSGTGLILMASGAIKSGLSEKDKKFKVVGVDVNLNALMKTLQGKFEDFTSKTRSKGLIVFSYLKNSNNDRNLILNYTTDPSEWQSLYAFKDHSFFLKLALADMAKVNALESAAEHHADRGEDQFPADQFSFGESSYHCTISKVDRPNGFIWVCVK